MKVNNLYFTPRAITNWYCVFHIGYIEYCNKVIKTQNYLGIYKKASISPNFTLPFSLLLDQYFLSNFDDFYN